VVDWTPGYREFAPPAGLRAALSCLWIGVTSPDEPEQTLVLPDACSDLMWYSDAPAVLAGPDSGPAPVVQPAGSVVVGARFRPGAAGAVLGFPLADAADQRIDPTQVAALRGRLPAAGMPASLVPAALARLIGQLADERPPDTTVTTAARLLARPDRRAQDVAHVLGLSERQLRRRCQAGAGYDPRTLQRVLRFRRFVSAIDAGPLPPGGLASAALAAGYADQSHLTRECARLSGLTPRALAAVRGASARPEPRPAKSSLASAG